MKKILIITAALTLIASAAFARNKLEASIEMERVYIGNPVYLYLTFTGSSSVPQPDVPAPDGLRIRSVGSSTEMSVVNGVVSQSITYTYLVIPAKEGSYDIGPFYVVHDGTAYNAGTVRLTVDQTPPPGAVSGTNARRSSPPPARTAASGPSAPPSSFAPSGRAESAPYEGRDVFLVMEAPKRTLYVNEAMPVTIKLYVEGVGLKDIEYPVYSHEGFSAGEFLKPERKRGSYRGSIYDTLEFRQELFAIKEGEHVLGPARLNCKMISRTRTPSRRSSIFGVSVFMDDPFTTGFETYPIVLETEAIPVTVLPFPDKGRPADFKGAVGNFSFEAEVRPTDVKVGDPVTLVMTVAGYGNMDTVTAPALDDSDELKVYEPEVSKKGKKKIYEQILIPRNAGVKEVPQVRFSYFDPGKQRYETVTQGPFPIKVAKAPQDQAVRMVAMPMGEHVFVPEEELGRDVIHIKDSIGILRPKGHMMVLDIRFWALQLLPPVVFLMFYMSYRKRERIKTDRGYARLLKAPRKARTGLSRARAFLDKSDIAGFYDAVHKTLEEYLGNRFNLPRGSVTVDDIETRLRQAGCEEHILEKLRDVFAKCEMARYASSVSEDLSYSLVLHDVRTIIDHVEKMRV